MKTILIARHAKSSWRSSDLADIDRPLRSGGVLGAQQVANRLKELKITIDSIYASPAIRAMHTAIIHARQLDFPENRIEINSLIYEGGKEGIYKMITERIDPKYDVVMIVGHDPALTNFVNDFLQIPLEKIQTAGVIELKFDIDEWIDVKGSKPSFINYIKREEIKELNYAKASA
jgi:phosphohistidine phosphatase